MLFFERIPGLEVSGEKKRVVPDVPNRKICSDFYAIPKAYTHKSHKWFSGHYLGLPEWL